MSTKEKLRKRFLQMPKDFTFEEMCALLAGFGYTLDIHRPHPGNTMRDWMMKAVYEHLKSNKLIK